MILYKRLGTGHLVAKSQSMYLKLEWLANRGGDWRSLFAKSVLAYTTQRKSG